MLKHYLGKKLKVRKISKPKQSNKKCQGVYYSQWLHVCSALEINVFILILFVITVICAESAQFCLKSFYAFRKGNWFWVTAHFLFPLSGSDHRNTSGKKLFKSKTICVRMDPERNWTSLVWFKHSYLSLCSQSHKTCFQI